MVVLAENTHGEGELFAVRRAALAHQLILAALVVGVEYAAGVVAFPQTGHDLHF